MESSNQFNESFRQGLTAGYVFAATFVIVLYMSYCLPAQLIKNRKNKTGGFKKATQKRKLPLQELKQGKNKEKRKRARQIERELPPELLERRIKINDIGWLTCRTSFAELYEATEHFSEDSVLGEGRTGTMYKATLPNGWFLLAVKKLYDSELFIRSFDLEIMMGRYSHRNIMVPISFCIEEEKNERFLVYHYMSNGRISDWLNDTTTLGWPAVIRVALGVARGLCCLHHSLHMVHLSIGPESILLGNNFEPRISNFGMAIFIDYDPGKNVGFDKKDVYDFGTLLIEVIRGKTFGQTSNCFSNANTNGPFATYTYATNLFEDPSGFYDAVDKSLNEIEFEDEVSALLRVACDCVHPFPPKRPTMLEVYSKMSNIWERDGIFEDSSMS